MQHGRMDHETFKTADRLLMSTGESWVAASELYCADTVVACDDTFSVCTVRTLRQRSTKAADDITSASQQTRFRPHLRCVES
jgi:hypothetical protein